LIGLTDPSSPECTDITPWEFKVFLKDGDPTAKFPFVSATKNPEPTFVFPIGNKFHVFMLAPVVPSKMAIANDTEGQFS